jgi:hypothetical protein
MTRSPGLWRLRALAAPRSEAVVPTDWTKASTRPPVCSQISSVVAGDAVGVVELISPVGAWLSAELLGFLDHALDEGLRDQPALARDEGEFRAERRHLGQLVLAERV